MALHLPVLAAEATATNKPRLTRTLSFRLMVIFTTLLVVVSLALTMLSATVLSNFLLRNLDEDLISSGRIVAIDYLREQVFPTPGRDASADAFSLSDYYVYIDLDANWEEIIANDNRTLPNRGPEDSGGTGTLNPAEPSGTRPLKGIIEDADKALAPQAVGTAEPVANSEMQGIADVLDDEESGPLDVLEDSASAQDVTEEDDGARTLMIHDIRADLAKAFGAPANIDRLETTIGAQPATVAGTKGEDWRAIVLPIETPESHQIIGHVLIATPLAPRMNIISRITWVMMTITAGALLVGAIAIFVLVRRSMRPLERIERTTHAIAEGDLSQRVPPGPEGSEVGMLSDSINVMLAQIEHSFEVKSQSEAKMRRFVSDASHELRTPLATVRGYAELYRLGGVPEDKLPQTMSRVESEAVRMAGLVEDLLQLARLDEGRPLELSEVSLVDIAEDAIADLDVRGDGRQGRVVGIDGVVPDELTVIADENKVVQVVANLLTNVLTHTPAGSPVEIALGSSADASHAFIEIRDHGPGVPAEQRERIFERFYRTDSSRSRASGGSGLGLSIVSSIMEAHGGTATALETDGGGLTVRLAFPVDGPSTEQKRPA